MSSPPPSVAVLGAGISGLSAACRLRQSGIVVVVLEKSRSLGGRCATRLWEGHVVDHGAQYFTMRDPEFKTCLEALCPEKLGVLGGRVRTMDGRDLTNDAARWFHRDGNNRLGRALAEGLDVRKEVEVRSIERGSNGLVCRLKDGSTAGPFRAVVSSLPWPQSAAVLGLEPLGTDYQECLTSFFSYSIEGDLLPPDYGVMDSRPDAVLGWSACENWKPGRIQPGVLVFVAQAGLAFSKEYFDAPREVWSDLMQQELEQIWGLARPRRQATFNHRWRYARNLQPLDPTVLPAGVFLCGDSITTSRVEDAWRSGRDVGDRVADTLQAGAGAISE